MATRPSEVPKSKPPGYLCTWQGWPESDKTWEKEEELPVDLVNAYKARIREQYQAGV